MIQAKGNGLSECFKCKSEGKYSLTWTSFLYYIKNINGNEMINKIIP